MIKHSLITEAGIRLTDVSYWTSTDDKQEEGGKSQHESGDPSCPTNTIEQQGVHIDQVIRTTPRLSELLADSEAALERELTQYQGHLREDLNNHEQRVLCSYPHPRLERRLEQRHELAACEA